MLKTLYQDIEKIFQRRYPHMNNKDDFPYWLALLAALLLLLLSHLLFSS